jgi:hypothetical protein
MLACVNADDQAFSACNPTLLVFCVRAVGAVLGFGFVFGGAESIVWNRTIDQFPYRQGVVRVRRSYLHQFGALPCLLV